MPLVHRPRAAVLTQLNLVVLVTVGLLWFGLFTIRLFYILVFLGLLVTTQLYAPVDREPNWYVPLKWLTRIGFIGLLFIVYQRATLVLGP